MIQIVHCNHDFFFNEIGNWCSWFPVYVTFSLFSCGSIDSIYGPVRNPWQYKFRIKQTHVSESTVAHGFEKEKVIQGTRAVHTSCVKNDVLEQNKSLDESDWFISGGSSGGSAVAVASGTCFG